MDVLNNSEDKEILTGVIIGIVYSNDDTSFRVFKVEKDDSGAVITVAGKSTSFRNGERVKVIGKTEKTKYGKQFSAELIKFENSVTEEGMVESLCGLVKGIGPAKARKLIRCFGGVESFINSMDQRLEQESLVIPVEMFDDLKNKWHETRVEREVDAELASLNLSPGIRTKLRARYGGNAANIVKTDPYRIPIEVDGIGFITADDIAIEAGGIDINSVKRLDAATLHCLREDSLDSGHTTNDINGICKSLCNLFMKRVPPGFFIDNPLDRTIDSIQRLIENGLIVSFNEHFSLEYLLEFESKIAGSLERLARSVTEWPSTEGAYAGEAFGGEQSANSSPTDSARSVQLTDEQNIAVNTAIEKGLVVITGGPGVGKTTTCKTIVDIATSNGLLVKLCAPTARAAKRLSESTGLDASTIHRLLEPNYGGKFVRDKDNPIEADLILADEMSMCDVDLMSKFLEAIPDGCRLILVGDKDQLPPVGPGCPFRDIINSKTIHVSRLNKIHRQSEGSAIVVGSHSVLSGSSPKVSKKGDRSSGCLHHVSTTSEDASKIVVSILSNSKEELGIDPSDIICLSPMRKGFAGVNQLNKEIQDKINPKSNDKKEITVGSKDNERTFRIGDKVRQTKNDYKRLIVNGDIGKVIFVEDRDSLKDDVIIKVDFEGVGIVDYTKDQLQQLVLAYCGTIHSIQGCEAPVVIIVLVDSHYIMLTRTLLYTAMTRAKRACILVGSSRAVSIAARNNKDDSRKTNLKLMLENVFK
jgi:exodeoxyribonuclease V alpha subunit